MSDRDQERAAAFAEAIRRGRAGWPEVVADDAALSRAFATMAIASADAAALREAHDDLFLACACLAGSASAKVAFERMIMVDVPKAVRRVDTNATFIDDVTADLRVSLLGGDAGAPGLVRYAGRGPLRSFVMVLAMRRALDRKRRQREVPVESESFEMLLGAAGVPSPESPLVHDAFTAALKEGLASLEPRDRNLLRMHFVDGVSAEALARTYKVHRATMTRWITAAKEAVIASTREVMARDHAVSEDTFASLARAAADLDATLSTFLGEQDRSENEGT